MEFVARLAFIVLLTAVVVPETVGMYSGMAAPSKAALLNKVGVLKDSLGCSPIKTTEELQTELLGLLKLFECNTGIVPDALAGDVLGLVEKLLQRQVNSADGLVKQLSQLVQPLGCKITQTKDEVVIQLLLNLVQGLCCPKLQPIEALLAAAKLKSPPPAQPVPKKLPPPPQRRVPAKLPPPPQLPPKKLPPPPPPCCPDGTVDLNNLVGQVIGAVGGTVDGVFKPVVGLLGDVVSTVGDVVGAIRPAPPSKEGLLPTVGNLLGNVVGAVDGVVDGVLPPVGGLLGNVVGDVGNVVDGVLPPVGDLVGDVLGTVDGTVSGLLRTRNLVGGLGGSVGNILGSVDGVVDGVLPPVGNLVGNVVGGVGGVVDGLLPPVGNLVGNVVDAVDDLLGGGDAPADCNCNNVDVIKPVVTLLGNVVTTVGTVVDTLNGGVVKPVAGLVETVGQALPCAICNPNPTKADLLPPPPPPSPLPAPPKPSLNLNNLYLDLKNRVDILELYQPDPEPPKCPLCQINLKQDDCPNCDLLASACEYSSSMYSLEPSSESTNIKSLVLPPPPSKGPVNLLLEAVKKLSCRPAKPVPVLLQSVLKIARSLNCPTLTTIQEQVSILLELLEILANNPPSTLGELRSVLRNLLQVFGCTPKVPVDVLINDLIGLIMDLSCQKLAPIENLLAGPTSVKIKFCPISGKLVTQPPPPPPSPCAQNPDSLLLDAVSKLGCRPAKPVAVLKQSVLKIATRLNCPTLTSTNEQIAAILELLEILANNPPSSLGELRSVLRNYLQVFGCSPLLPVDVLINELVELIMDLSCQKLAPVEDLLIGPTGVQASPCSVNGQFIPPPPPPPPPASTKNAQILILQAANKLGCKPTKPIPVLLQAILKIGRSLNCPNFSTTNEQVTIVLELLEILANNPPRSLDELQVALLNFLQTFGCSPLLPVDALINELVGLIMDLSCRKLAPIENLINGNAPACPYTGKVALPSPAKNPVSLLLDAVKKLSCKPAKPLPVLLQSVLKIANGLNCPTLTTTGEQVATILELLEILAYNPPDSLSELQSTLLNFIQVYGCSPLLSADALVNEIIELILDLSCQKLAPLENLVSPCPFTGRRPPPPPTEKNLVVLLLEAVQKLACRPSKPLPVLLQNILKIAQSLNCPNLTTSEKVKSILGLLEILANNPPRTYSELKAILLNFLQAFDCTPLLPPDALVNELLGLIVDLSCKKLEPLVGLLAGGVVSCPYSGIAPLPPPEKNPTTLLISAINKLACRPAKPVPVLLKSILKIARNLNCPSLTTQDEQACAVIELLELLASNPPSSLGELRSVLRNFLQLFGCSVLLPKDVIINELLGLISDLCCQKLAPLENLLAGSPSPQDFAFATINANSYSTVIDLFSQELISLTKDLQCSPSKSPTDLAEELHALLSNLVCDSCSDVDDLYFEVLKLIRLLSRGGVQSPEDFAHIFNNVLQKYKCKTSEPVELLVEKLLGFIRNLYCKRLNWVSPILKGLMPVGKLLGHSLT